MSCSTLVTVDELGNEMTPEEYSAFLEHQRKTADMTEATLRDGVPIDFDENILRGAEILLSVSSGA